MDKSKIVPVIIGIVLSIASAFLGYNLKDQICGGAASQSQSAK